MFSLRLLFVLEFLDSFLPVPCAYLGYTIIYPVRIRDVATTTLLSTPCCSLVTTLRPWRQNIWVLCPCSLFDASLCNSGDVPSDWSAYSLVSTTFWARLIPDPEKGWLVIRIQLLDPRQRGTFFAPKGFLLQTSKNNNLPSHDPGTNFLADRILNKRSIRPLDSFRKCVLFAMVR